MDEIRFNKPPDDEMEIDVRRFILWFISATASWFVLLGVLFLLFGCAGVRQTAKEPIHAESGTGITVWKIPIVGFGEWGGDNYGQEPNVIVHKYDYTAKPQPTPPGTSPTPPQMQPPIDYLTIYGSTWDDPSLVVFKNESYWRVKVQINRQKPIVLEPYGATSDLHLGVGEHRIRLTVEKPTTAHGTWEIISDFPIQISPRGRSQIFNLYDYGSYYDP